MSTVRVPAGHGDLIEYLTKHSADAVLSYPPHCQSRQLAQNGSVQLQQHGDTTQWCAAVVRVRPANAGEGRYFVRVPEGVAPAPPQTSRSTALCAALPAC